MTGSAAWADALQALALFAIDPVGLGGISLRAGAGPVRDHWLSLLKDALPPETPLRRLPVNTSDDRLLGGLDLAATLEAGRPIAQKGLLAEADGGIVILAMAERTEPGTAARLRAVLDDGAVTLQRDGLSRVLPTRFGLVALDEGADPEEHPPASLLDRLAFHLDLTEVSTRDIEDPTWTAQDLTDAGRLLERESAASDRVSGDQSSASPATATHQPTPPAAAIHEPSPPVTAADHQPSPPVMGADQPSFHVMAGLGPATHDLRNLEQPKSWMAGTRPAMTQLSGQPAQLDKPDGAEALTTADPHPDADSHPGAGPHPGADPRPGAGPQQGTDPHPTADAAEALTTAAEALGIASLRAPLLALRAARAAAALTGRTDLTDTDLGLAARLVFVSRATRFPAPPQDAEQPEPPPPPPEDDNQDEVTIPDQPLADVILEAALAALPPDLLQKLLQQNTTRGAVRSTGRAGQTRLSNKRGRPVGTRQGELKGGARLHLLETLKAAAPWQTLRLKTNPDAPPRFHVHRDDFRIIRFRQRIGTTTVFAVDASGSAAMQRLGEAKGAVELLLADCYVRRDQVALIAFRGHGAQILLPPTGSLLRAKRSLAGLPGGGPTPLAAGIDAALAMADQVRRAGRTPVITILTDGRANIGRDGAGGRPRAEAEALESARLLRATGFATLLVDTSPRPNPFARKLADEMRAHYVPLPYADPAALSRAVRNAAA